MSETSTYGTFGRYTEIPVNQMTPEQKEGEARAKRTASLPAGGARPAKLMKAEFTTKSILNH